MNAPKLKRRRNAYKARAVKLKKEIEDMISKGEEACNIEHKCQQLKEQLRTIKELSENICDVLDSDEEAAAFMEETYQFTDDCDDLIMTASKKNDKAVAEKANKDK